MRVKGFYSVPCGKDGPDAWAIDEEWNRRWLAVKRGDAPSPAMVGADKLSPEKSEQLTVYPPRSLGEAFRRYRRTEEWASTANARRLVARLETDKAYFRRLRPAHHHARNHQRMAQGY
jgi:hypothetical protein